MKIVFFTRLFWPHVGGVEKHVLKLSTELIKKGHKVTVVTTKYDKILKEKETINGIKIIRFAQPNIKYLGLLHTWYWVIKHLSLFKQSDILHFHDVFVWYWPLRLLTPFKKVFATFHGQWGKYPISKIDILQKRLGAIFSSGHISIGDYISKNYGFNADIVLYGATDVFRKAAEDKDNTDILYVGRLDADLPVKKYFEIFKKLTKYNINILGDGDLRNDAMMCGKVHGFVDPYPFYKKAKCVFASGYLTIIESLANKCLVFVSYNNPLQKDYYELTPFKKFIICDNNSGRLYEKLIYFSKHKTEADKLIEEGYKWAKEQTWRKAADLYIELWTK
jgi:glycosyltransferase involved in cell wall biosynthesis